MSEKYSMPDIHDDWVEKLSQSAYPNAIESLNDLAYCYNLAVSIQDYINNVWPDLYEKATHYHGELALKPAQASYEHCLELNEQIYDKTRALELMIEDMDYADSLLFLNALDAREIKSKLEPLAKGKNKDVIEYALTKLRSIYETGRTTRLWKYFEEVVNENPE